MKEIHNFVTVALVTEAGGEGDLSHDKLSSLSKVGSGFASLIYDFPKTAGFTELKEACENVWEALDKNKNLPALLVSRHLYHKCFFYCVLLPAGNLQQGYWLVSISKGDSGINRIHILWSNEEYS